MARPWLTSLLAIILFDASSVSAAEDVSGIAPLQHHSLAAFALTLPSDVHLLNASGPLEVWLSAIDGTPPDWATVYGHGHHDPGHDDRLFALNRERDAKREGNPALQTRLAFVWSGELSTYDPETGGYGVTLGPVFTATNWGMVRFKPVDLPGELRAVPEAGTKQDIRERLAQGQPMSVTVLFVGRLIPDESLVYDFSHDQDGLGLIMPFVQVEHVSYLWEP